MTEKVGITKEMQRIRSLEAALEKERRQAAQMEDKVRSQQDTIDQLTQKKAEVLREKYSQDDEIKQKARLEEQLKAMAGELVVVRNQLQSAQRSTTALEMENSHIVNNANSTIRKWEEAQLVWEESEVTLKTDLEATQQQLHDKEHTVQQQLETIRRLTSELAEEKKKQSRVAREGAQAEALVQNLQQQIDDLTNEVAEVTMRRAEVEDNHQRMLDSVTKLRQDAERALAKNNVMELRVGQLSDEVTSLNAKISNLREELVRKEAAIEERDAEVAKRDATIARIERENERINFVVDQKATYCSRSDTKLSEMQQRLGEAEGTVRDLQEHIRFLELEAIQHTGESKKLDGTVREREEIIAKLHREIETADAAAKAHEARIAELTVAADDMKRKASADGLAIESFQSTIRSLEKDVERRAAVRAQLEEQVAALTTRLQHQEEGRVLDGDAMEAARRQLAAAQEELVAVRAQLEEAHEAIDVGGASMQALQERLQATGADHASALKHTASLLATAEAEATRHAAEGAALRARMAELETDLTKSTGSLAAERHRADGLERANSTAESAIAALKDEKHALQEKLQRAAGAADEVERARDEARRRVKALEGRLEEAEGALERSERRLASKQADVDTVLKRKDAYKEKLLLVADRRSREVESRDQLLALQAKHLQVLQEATAQLQQYVDVYRATLGAVTTAIAVRGSTIEAFVGPEISGRLQKAIAESATASARVKSQNEALRDEYDRFDQIHRHPRHGTSASADDCGEGPEAAPAPAVTQTETGGHTTSDATKESVIPARRPLGERSATATNEQRSSALKRPREEPTQQADISSRSPVPVAP